MGLLGVFSAAGAANLALGRNALLVGVAAVVAWWGGGGPAPDSARWWPP